MGTSPKRPNDSDIDEETRRILDERLKTADQDQKTARPWREVLNHAKRKLEHPAPR